MCLLSEFLTILKKGYKVWAVKDDMEDTYLALDRLEYPQKIWTQEELEAEVDLAH